MKQWKLVLVIMTAGCFAATYSPAAEAVEDQPDVVVDDFMLLPAPDVQAEEATPQDEQMTDPVTDEEAVAAVQSEEDEITMDQPEDEAVAEEDVNVDEDIAPTDDTPDMEEDLTATDETIDESASEEDINMEEDLTPTDDEDTND